MPSRIDVTLKEDLALAIESEYHRLHQELIKLKKAGAISKRKRLRQIDVLRAIIVLGVTEIRKIGYTEFTKIPK